MQRACCIYFNLRFIQFSKNSAQNLSSEQMYKMELIGLEPTTSGLQSPRSPN